ncbi:Pentatricopeptide repeat-containing protein, mitochondrial [Glycine soja]|uniref:Pentatricopeptide repeat-containing protein, mitochondrial n=1 Tax=Glycine soja TaxID=3848 RepID=A0A445I8A7_GLYSO|nr:Pentatricopeptide repeat-containing protein, mitochondrial [Glycine soja]
MQNHLRNPSNSHHMVKTGLCNAPFTLSKLLAASILDMDYVASIFSYIQTPNLFMFNTMLRGYSVSNFPNKAISATVNNALLHFHCVCKRIEDALKLFDEFPEGNDLVSWNTLMGGVATVLSLLSAAGDIGNFGVGKSLHGYCFKIGFCSNLNVITALIDLELCKKWNQGMKPNSSILSGLLSTCPASGSVQVVHHVASFVEEQKLKLDVVLGTALVDVYAKCGFLDEAMDIFERMEDKDVKSWTAMISGLGVHGQPNNVIRLFNRMEKEGFRPNEVTFLAILTACSHGGLVVEGTEMFKHMVQEYRFSPQVKHYGCLIDLLGRAGMLLEAHKLIDSLPIKGDKTAWQHCFLLAESMEMLN